MSCPFTLTAEPTAVDGASTEIDIWVDAGVGAGVGVGLGLGEGLGVDVGTSSNVAEIVCPLATTLTNVYGAVAETPSIKTLAIW